MTNDLGQTFTYDATGQQATASYSGYLLQQTYDGDRLRVKKVENGTTTYYLRSTVLGGQIVAELNGSGSVVRGFVYLGGQLLAVQQNNQVSWVHQDPVAKSKRVTNSAGTVISTIELDPWGGDTNRSNNEAFQPRRFTTYDRDGNASDEAMHRRYNRWHSRFDQPDPYGGSYNMTNPQSFNRYSYVQNDPVNFLDPSGLDPDFGLGPPPPVPTLVPPEGPLDRIITNTWGRLGTGAGGVSSGAMEIETSVDGPTEAEIIPQDPVGPIIRTIITIAENYDPETPCMERTEDVKRDINTIAEIVSGKVTNQNLRQRYSGGNINPQGQSYGSVVQKLEKNGFEPNLSLSHSEGKGFQKQFKDGLWFHVVVNFPKTTVVRYSPREGPEYIINPQHPHAPDYCALSWYESLRDYSHHRHNKKVNFLTYVRKMWKCDCIDQSIGVLPYIRTCIAAPGLPGSRYDDRCVHGRHDTANFFFRGTLVGS